MLSLSLPARVFLCTLPTDMRKSFDSLAGLVQEELGQDPLSGDLFVFAFLIKIDRIVLKPDLLFPSPVKNNSRPFGWKKFTVTDFFDLKRGNFHSIANLDPGEYPTISRVSNDNGLVGFFDKPKKARIWEPGSITVSTVGGDAFVQPVPFIATDNVVMCLPNADSNGLSLAEKFFIRLMIDQVKWRYSYGRQCYKTKFAKTEIALPVKQNGDLDGEYMKLVVENTTYWPLVNAVF